MKRKMLLGFSILCMVAALIIAVVPVMADSSNQKITISKEAVISGTTVTCTVVIQNSASSGYPLTIESVYDTVYHTSSTPTITIVPDLYPAFTLAKDESKTLIFTYELAGDDVGEIADTIVASGYHTSASGKHLAAGATESATILPVPELSAGILFGLGALGLGGFILLRRKEAAAKV